MPVKRYKGDKAKCDKWFSEIVRSLGYCEAEGYDDRKCSHQLQTAHIITRKRSATRTDFRNAYCLCFAHHRWFTDYPREFSKFISTTWAQAHYQEVYERSIIPTKINWKERAEEIKPIHQQIKNGEVTLNEVRTYPI